MPVMAAVLSETVDLGVFGGDSLLYSLAGQRICAETGGVERALDFDALWWKIPAPGERACGCWAGITVWSFYEDPACRPSDWQAAGGNRRYMEKALRLFRERISPPPCGCLPGAAPDAEDKGRRWYLFRCETRSR